MIILPDWLPGLVLFDDYEGNWERFIEDIYMFFRRDFIENQAIFNSQPVRMKRYPLLNGKEAAFWHITSEGKVEDSRLPDIRRCERIRWPRPIIEHFTDSKIKCWKNKRKNDDRIILWFDDLDYVIVLAERQNYVLLWTAYFINYKHTREKLQKEFEASHKG